MKKPVSRIIFAVVTLVVAIVVFKKISGQKEQADNTAKTSEGSSENSSGGASKDTSGLPGEAGSQGETTSRSDTTSPEGDHTSGAQTREGVSKTEGQVTSSGASAGSQNNEGVAGQAADVKDSMSGSGQPSRVNQAGSDNTGAPVVHGKSSAGNAGPNAAELAGNNAGVIPGAATEAPKDLARAAGNINLRSGSAQNVTPDAGGKKGEKVATVTPSQTPAPASVAPQAPAVPAEKPVPNFPGIEQPVAALMVSDVRYKAGEGEDTITVAITQVDGQSEVEGNVWIIGEYVQRGTTGIMFMPSHNELKLAADGKPKFPNNGVKYQVRSVVEKKMTVRRPGFEGEELVGVRVGLVDKKTGQVHLAKISMKQIVKKAKIKRAKVDAP